MFCNVCGTQLPASSAFCPQCGTTLAPESASQTMIRHAPDEQKEPVVPVPQESQPGTTYEQPAYPAASSIPLYTGTRQYPAYPQYPQNVVPRDPYNAPPVYDTPAPLVPSPQFGPPPQRRPGRRWKLLVLVSVIVVLLLASCAALSTTLYNAINSGLKATTTIPHSESTPSTQVTRSPIVQEPNPYPPFKGQLVLSDPLQDNSRGYKWGEFNDASLYCQFADNAYRLRLQPQSKYQIDWCFANNTDYSNLAFQVEMTMSKGDCGGLIFHNAGDRELYYFCITHQGGYGFYMYYKDSAGTVQVKELAKGDSSSIYTGYNTKNLIAVSTENGAITLYVNNKSIQRVVDKTFSHGQIGLAAHQYDSKETDVLFQNAKVWTF